MIRQAKLSDAGQIADIYNFYVRNTSVTFEEKEVSKGQMKGRIKDKLEKYVFLVWEEDGKVLGYAYAGEWKGRCAYRQTVESSVYLRKEAAGRGIGTKLCEKLLEQLKQKGFHTVLAGIAIPNEASVALHEKLGFVKTGQLREVGFKGGRYIDVGYWQIGLG